MPRLPTAWHGFTSDWGAAFEPVRAPLAAETVIESHTGRSSHGQHPC